MPHRKKYTCSQFMRKPSITKILKRCLLVGKKVLYKFPYNIASQLLTLSWSFEILRLHRILLISELNSCLILMFEYSLQSLEPPLQESELLLPLGGPQVSEKCWHLQFLACFCHFWVPYSPLVANLLHTLVEDVISFKMSTQTSKSVNK